MTCALSAPAKGYNDAEYEAEAVELITTQVAEVFDLPFVPDAFEEFFISRLVRILLWQCGPDLPRMIHDFVEKNQNAYDAAGLEGLVDEIVRQLAPQCDLPILGPEEEKAMLRIVVNIVVAYSCPGAAVMMLGTSAVGGGGALLQSSVESTASMLQADKRVAVVEAVEKSIPQLPLVPAAVQHQAVQWAVDTVGALMTAVIPSEVAEVMVSFSDDELADFKEHIREVAIAKPSSLDMVIGTETKAMVVSTVVDAAFNVLFEATGGDVAADKRLAVLSSSERELQRKIDLLQLSTTRKTKRLHEQLQATTKQKELLLKEHPDLGPPCSWYPYGAGALVLGASCAAVLYAKNTPPGAA